MTPDRLNDLMSSIFTLIFCVLGIMLIRKIDKLEDRVEKLEETKLSNTEVED